ncbi:MAG: potassium channel protein [Anaerolineales bacterium]|nr:potassium channel protein [Anaerolineales bacterium]
MSASFQRHALRRLAVAASVLTALLIIGAAGYHWLEGISPLDAVYMTVITLSTVGFGEVKPLTPLGRLFTIGLIIGGAGVAAYLLSSAAELILSTDLRQAWERRRRHRMLAKLSNHVIVCGYGRVGRFIAHTLKAEGLPFVVIDLNAEKVEQLEAEGVLALAGNAANEARLKEAGIERARALMVAANSDAENVFIVLTARSLRPDLFIAARANFEESESKLLKAGANRVILPYRIAGRRMVTTLLRPAVADFLDEVTHAGGLELLLEQVPIAPGSALAGRTLGELQLRTRFDVNVLACRTPDGALLTRPTGSTRLEAGMELIVLGADRALQELLKLAQHPSD